MARLIKCDICGKEVDEENGYIKVQFRNTVDIFIDFEHLDRDYDFCPQCAEKTLEYISERQKTEKNK